MLNEKFVGEVNGIVFQCLYQRCYAVGFSFSQIDRLVRAPMLFI